MRFFEWISSAFKDKKQIDLTKDRLEPEDEYSVAIQAYALFTVIEMIAGILSKCEFKTYKNGVEFKGMEWYSLNVSPNKNQSSTEFWMEFFCKLLYYQEVLVVDSGDGQKIIADDFQREEYAIKDDLFKQVTRNTFTFQKTFRASEVFYLRYTNNNLTGILNNIFNMYHRLIGDAVEKYSVNAGERGTLKLSAVASGDPNFEKNFADLMNNRFKTYFKRKNSVLPLYNGMDYSSSKKDTSKNEDIADIKTLFDEALSRSAQAFKVPPALVKGEVAGLKDAFDVMFTVCIDPLANMSSEEMTRKEYKPEQVISGNYIDADTTCIKHIDIFEAASNIDKLISSGYSSINEVRSKSGLPAINEEWADKHWITKNYQEVNEVEGGEINE